MYLHLYRRVNMTDMTGTIVFCIIFFLFFGVPGLIDLFSRFRKPICKECGQKMLFTNNYHSGDSVDGYCYECAHCTNKIKFTI